MERGNTKNRRWEERGEGEEGKADKRMEPGLEHPGKTSKQTGTTGGRKPWTGTSGDEAGLGWNFQGYRVRRIWRRREAARRK